jgi:hypothetical protein
MTDVVTGKRKPKPANPDRSYSFKPLETSTSSRLVDLVRE